MAKAESVAGQDHRPETHSAWEQAQSSLCSRLGRMRVLGLCGKEGV